jgi:hypothetical protein
VSALEICGFQVKRLALRSARSIFAKNAVSGKNDLNLFAAREPQTLPRWLSQKNRVFTLFFACVCLLHW